MQPMKLAEVRKHTGRQLTYAEAIKLANPGDPVPPQHGHRPVASYLEQHSPGLAATGGSPRDSSNHKQRRTRR